MKLFSSRRSDRQAAEELYEACVRAARRPALYAEGGVPDTLQGRFEMLAMHLFPLIYRLMHRPGDDPELARLVTERFVADMDGAFREMGVGDLSVPKRMQTLYRSFGGRIDAYKRGLEGEAEALAEAIQRNVFPDAPASRAAGELARHLNAAVDAVRQAELGRLRRGELAFPEPFRHRAERVR